jgi:hypothetical protein
MLRLLARLQNKDYFVCEKRKSGVRLSIVIGQKDRSQCWSPLFYLQNLNSSLGHEPVLSMDR